ncbi:MULTISPECIES: hypothetical protein [unclassified Streptomyces]|uniref:hypothetical protein n=1 Tax=unclassified Streptomyces TaxID=2593676 RepID=UPI00382BBF78
MKVKPRTVIVALIFYVLIVGCANDRRMDDMNMQEAADYADKVMDSTVNGIEPEVQWVHGPTTTGSCTVTRRRAVMTIVSAARRGNLLGLVERMWRSRNYRIKGVNSDTDSPAIYAQTLDGFGVTLIVGGEGQVFFEVDSPCVKESEVADPIAAPNGPTDAHGEIIPRPNIHSDFWSADAS